MSSAKGKTELGRSLSVKYKTKQMWQEKMRRGQRGQNENKRMPRQPLPIRNGEHCSMLRIEKKQMTFAQQVTT